MKQHITVEQFDELGNKQRQLLRDWWRPRPGDHAYFEGRYKVMIEADTPFVGTSGVKYYPILSIGQMIEFLSDKGNNFWISYNRNPMLWSYTKGKTPHPEDQNTVPEICDALWEAVKEELEK